MTTELSAVDLAALYQHDIVAWSEHMVSLTFPTLCPYTVEDVLNEDFPADLTN